MKAIQPISTEQCRPYYGKPVCVVLRDGTELFGTLSRFDGNKLILNEEATVSTKKTKAIKSTIKSKKGNTARKAAASGQTANTLSSGPVPGFSPFGGPIALDSASIGLLFALD